MKVHLALTTLEYTAPYRYENLVRNSTSHVEIFNYTTDEYVIGGQPLKSTLIFY